MLVCCGHIDFVLATIEVLELRGTYMVAVYTVICLAILTRRTRVLASQYGNRLNLIIIDLILMSKRANFLLRARPSEIVIIAELVVVFSLFDSFQHLYINSDGFVKTTVARIPIIRYARRDQLIL